MKGILLKQSWSWSYQANQGINDLSKQTYCGQINSYLSVWHVQQYSSASEGVKYGLLEFFDDLMNLVNRTESTGPISTAGADNLSGIYEGPSSVVQKLRAA